MMAGSSPLTRGKHIAVCDPACVTRLIPAHAGKTGNGWIVPVSAWAHPRSRGENEWPVVSPVI